MKVLIIDDQRIFKEFPYDPGITPLVVEHVQTSQEGVERMYGEYWDVVQLDHDLGDESDMSGTDIANHIEDRVYVEGVRPSVGVYVLHSANPVGRDYMRRVLEGIGEEVEIMADPYPYLDLEQMDKRGLDPWLRGPRR